MKTLLIEIRDRMTTIAALAIKPEIGFASPAMERAFWGREGFGPGTIVLMKIGDQEAHSDAYGWAGGRTMGEAHKYIEANFDDLKDGAVVDVEYVLGESAQAKLPEIWRA
jgi:hypothetical protein